MMLLDIEFTSGKELKAKSMDLSEWLGWNQGKSMMEEPKPSGLILRSLKTPSSLKPLFLKADTFMVILLSFPWPLRRQHSRAVLSTPYPNRACLHQKDEPPLISLQKVPLTAPVICYKVVVGFWRKCSRQQRRDCVLWFTVIDDESLGRSACVVSGGTLTSLCWVRENRAQNKTVFGIKVWGFKTLLYDIRPANWNFRKKKCAYKYSIIWGLARTKRSVPCEKHGGIWCLQVLKVLVLDWCENTSSSITLPSRRLDERQFGQCHLTNSLFLSTCFL